MTVHCPENRSGLESIDDFVDQLLAQDHHRLLDLDIGRWREDLQARLARVQQQNNLKRMPFTLSALLTPETVSCAPCAQ